MQNILVGLAGIGLGNNPNGATADLRPLSTGVKAERPVLTGLVVALVAIWGLRMAEVFDNALYVVLTLVALAAAPALTGRRARRGHSGAVDLAAGPLNFVSRTSANTRAACSRSFPRPR